MAADLAELLPGELPDGVRDLPPEARAELAALIAAARRTQATDLDVAFEGVLKNVPFPVRPLARRILRG